MYRPIMNQSINSSLNKQLLSDIEANIESVNEFVDEFSDESNIKNKRIEEFKRKECYDCLLCHCVITITLISTLGILVVF